VVEGRRLGRDVIRKRSVREMVEALNEAAKGVGNERRAARSSPGGPDQHHH